MTRRSRAIKDGGRTRRRRTARERTVVALNLAPMVDIVFLLLIFFITTTTFKRAEGLLLSQLPKQGSLGTEIALPITPIVVHLTHATDGPLDYAIRIDSFVNAPTTFNELAAFLKDIQGNPGFGKDTPVVIRIQPDIEWDHVVSCWNAAVRAEFDQISFGTNG